jgi:hypothetical protein
MPAWRSAVSVALICLAATKARRTSEGVPSLRAWYRSPQTRPRRPRTRFTAFATRTASPWHPRARHVAPSASTRRWRWSAWTLQCSRRKVCPEAAARPSRTAAKTREPRSDGMSAAARKVTCTGTWRSCGARRRCGTARRPGAGGRPAPGRRPPQERKAKDPCTPPAILNWARFISSWLASQARPVDARRRWSCQHHGCDGDADRVVAAHAGGSPTSSARSARHLHRSATSARAAARPGERLRPGSAALHAGHLEHPRRAGPYEPSADKKRGSGQAPCKPEIG